MNYEDLNSVGWASSSYSSYDTEKQMPVHFDRLTDFLDWRTEATSVLSVAGYMKQNGATDEEVDVYLRHQYQADAIEKVVEVPVEKIVEVEKVVEVPCTFKRWIKGLFG